ncbi:GDSL-type esterase/lipase family protein [Dyadobacter psychrophilus]|uniref:GDSL-like Lipase/Acylhydrolase family protein n=1 Tax=Dyadobacter psychrophilus TaxID=651661 RepID=A0A1T5FST6_9BACT|nr:GDSL-type esterase/lipase family protein [Dyadobacter psychrophilus]SKB99238.1 GDSL-like Lipase/Acylhydrolase family protein [Dyadobacter psychrophilus]
MKFKFSTLIFLLVATLQVVAQNKKESKLAIVFIGNSITQGKGGTNGFPPPTHAVNYLKEEKGIQDVSFVNVGRSGSTTVDWLPGHGKYFSLATKAADSLFQQKDHQLLFSMKLGTNDSAMEGPNGAPVSKEDYRKNLQTIVNELLNKYPGGKVIIHHPIWYSTNTYNRSKYLAEGLARLESYVPEIDELIKEYKTSQPGRVFKGDTKSFKYFKKNAKKLFKPEEGQAGTFFLHPNEQGVAVLGKNWGKAISKIDL